LRPRLLLASSLALIFLAFVRPAWAWSNGGYSADPNNPDYGTHDWIAERSLEWIPANERALILTYRAAYLYGTELPDNNQAPDGIGDTTLHHLYFFANGSLQSSFYTTRSVRTQIIRGGSLPSRMGGICISGHLIRAKGVLPHGSIKERSR